MYSPSIPWTGDSVCAPCTRWTHIGAQNDTLIHLYLPLSGKVILMTTERRSQNELAQRIRSDATAGADGLIRMQGFIHHLADSNLLKRCGEELAEQFRHLSPTKILTAEVSGILASLPAGLELGIPVLIARKELPKTMQEPFFHESLHSRTKGRKMDLFILKECIGSYDRLLIIDDVLARGETTSALIRLADSAGAEVVGVGVLVEKVYEEGRERIRAGIPVHALCTITAIEDGEIRVAEGEQ